MALRCACKSNVVAASSKTDAEKALDVHATLQQPTLFIHFSFSHFCSVGQFLGDRLSPYAIGPLSVCPVLSVTLEYCGQNVGGIKMKVGVQVGLGPGHSVLDGDPGHISQRGTATNFRPISAVAKWLYGSRCHLMWTQASTQATLC